MKISRVLISFFFPRLIFYEFIAVLLNRGRERGERTNEMLLRRRNKSENAIN